jgi:hypothetical protein
MSRVVKTGRVSLLLSLPLMSGCAATGLSPQHYSVRTLPTEVMSELFEQVEMTLVGLGLRIDRREPLGGSITSAPFDATTRIGEGVLPPAPKPDAQDRRVALVHLRSTNGGYRVYCRVEVQREATQTFRLLSIEQTRTDVPSATPIEREAATTTEQNIVWKTVRRDFAAERAILDALLRQSGIPGGV